MATLRWCACTDPNQPLRPAVGNEDAVLTPQGVRQGALLVVGEVDASTPWLFAVSDGAHCAPQPARASRLLLEDLEALWHADPLAHPAAKVARLHERFCAHAVRQPRLAGMTATLVAAELRGSQALIYHVGDSAAFLIRAGQARRLTRDHTILERMVEEGVVGREQAQGLANLYNGLDRYFAAFADEENPQHDLLSLELQDGDTLLLASDGLSALALDQMAGCVTGDLPASARALLAGAVVAGSDDNISVLLLRLEAGPGARDTGPSIPPASKEPGDAQ